MSRRKSIAAAPVPNPTARESLLPIPISIPIPVLVLGLGLGLGFSVVPVRDPRVHSRATGLPARVRTRREIGHPRFYRAEFYSESYRDLFAGD